MFGESAVIRAVLAPGAAGVSPAGEDVARSLARECRGARAARAVVAGCASGLGHERVVLVTPRWQDLPQRVLWWIAAHQPSPWGEVRWAPNLVVADTSVNRAWLWHSHDQPGDRGGAHGHPLVERPWFAEHYDPERPYAWLGLARRELRALPEDVRSLRDYAPALCFDFHADVRRVQEATR